MWRPPRGISWRLALVLSSIQFLSMALNFFYLPESDLPGRGGEGTAFRVPPRQALPARAFSLEEGRFPHTGDTQAGLEFQGQETGKSQV